MQSLEHRPRNARATNVDVRPQRVSYLAEGRPSVTRRNAKRDEVGASLLLALIFLTVISVTVASLLGLIGGGLTDSIAFKQARTTESVTNSTAELALQNVRYNFMANTINSPNPVPCTTSTPGLQGLPAMGAYCRTLWNQISGSRTVTASVCRSGVDPLECENRPLLQAVVYFNDNSVSSKNDCTPVTVPLTTATTCGSGLSVVSWVIDATPPTVTNVSPGSSSTITCTSGASPLVITGTGFLYTNGFPPRVSFNDPSGYTWGTDSSISVLSDSTINACSPVNTGATKQYMVTVTTPSGTSAYNSGSNNGFTY